MGVKKRLRSLFRKLTGRQTDSVSKGRKLQKRKASKTTTCYFPFGKKRKGSTSSADSDRQEFTRTETPKIRKRKENSSEYPNNELLKRYYDSARQIRKRKRGVTSFAYQNIESPKVGSSGSKHPPPSESRRNSNAITQENIQNYFINTYAAFHKLPSPQKVPKIETPKKSAVGRQLVNFWEDQKRGTPKNRVSKKHPPSSRRRRKSNEVTVKRGSEPTINTYAAFHKLPSPQKVPKIETPKKPAVGRQLVKFWEDQKRGTPKIRVSKKQPPSSRRRRKSNEVTVKRGSEPTVPMSFLKFYQNQLKLELAQEEVSIDDIHLTWWDRLDKLEFLERPEEQRFRQWLFPVLETESNSVCFELTPSELDAMKNDSTVRGRILLTYRMILNFYGIHLMNSNTGKVEEGITWLERRNYLTNSSDILIRQMLTSLSQFNFEYLMKPLLMLIARELHTLLKINRNIFKNWVGTLDSCVDIVEVMNLVFE